MQLWGVKLLRAGQEMRWPVCGNYKHISAGFGFAAWFRSTPCNGGFEIRDSDG